MADATELFININTNLAKNLQVSEKLLNSIDDILVKNQGNFNKINDSYNDINKNQDAWNKKLKEGKGLVGGIWSGFKEIGKTMFGFMALKGIGEIFGEWAKSSQELKDIAFRMGQGARGYRELKNAATAVTLETGISTEKAHQLVAELARLRISSGDMKELATNSALFSEVTGVSADSTARMVGELSKAGGIGAKGVSSLMTTMARTQRAVGMTEADMEGLAEATIKNTRTMVAFGKSSAGIESFNTGVVKLAGSFTKVGLSARDATELIEKLIDPTQIEDNAMLLSQLGYSMEEALTGNIDPGDLSNRMSTMAKGLKDAGLGGTFFAKQMGIGYTQLNQYANMTSDLGKETGETLDTMRGQQLTPAKELETIGNKLAATFQGILNQLEGPFGSLTSALSSAADSLFKAINGLTGSGFISGLIRMVSGLVNLLSNPMMLVGLILTIGAAILFFRKKMYSANMEVSKNLGNGITSAVGMASERASVMSNKAFGEGSRRWSEDRKKRIMETYQYQALQEQADHTTMVANSNTYFKGVIAWSARVARTASMGVPAASLMLQLEDQKNKRIVERFQLVQNEGKLLEESKRQSAAALENERSRLKTRFDQLSAMGKLTAAQKIEYNNIDDALKSVNYKIGLVEESADRINRKYTKRADSMFKMVSDDDLAKMKQASDKSTENFEITKDLAKVKKIQLETDKEALGIALGQLNTEKNTIAIAIKEGTATGDQITRYHELNDQINKTESMHSKISNELIEQDETIRKAEAELAKEAELQTRINKIMGDRAARGKAAGDVGTLRDMTGFWDRIKKTSGAFVRDAVDAAKMIGVKISASAANLKDAAITALKNAPKALAAMGGGTGPLAMVKGAGKAMFTKQNEDGTRSINTLGKSMGALGLVMGIVAGIFQKNQKVQEILSKVMELVGSFIGFLVEKLLPPILSILKPFIKLFFMLVEKIMFPLVQLLLPPLLGILGRLVQGLGYFVKYALGWAGLGDVGAAMIDAGSGLVEAADTIKGMKNPFSQVDPVTGKTMSQNFAEMIDNFSMSQTPTAGATGAAAAGGEEAPLYLMQNKSITKVNDGTQSAVNEKKQVENTQSIAQTSKESSNNTNAMRKLNEEQVNIERTNTQVLINIEKKLDTLNATIRAQKDVYSGGMP